MIEVDPINQWLSKCRLEWFVPGFEELGSQSWLYCGAVWSAIFGAGTREPVLEPLDCLCVTGKCFLASLACCCRLKLAALGRSGPLGAVHVGSWAWHSNTWCLLSWCLLARVAWLLAVVVIGTLYLSGGDKYWTCESFYVSAYIDPYLWVTCVLRGSPGASGGHVAMGAAVVMSSVPSYCWLLYTCACLRHWYQLFI